MKTIEINAAKYADSDDCLADAERDYCEEHDLEGWDLSPRWADDERETILLSVPSGDDDDTVTVEIMPEHLRGSHRAARNWGVYPLNGAVRQEMPRAEAEELCEGDEYNHIVG